MDYGILIEAVDGSHDALLEFRFGAGAELAQDGTGGTWRANPGCNATAPISEQSNSDCCGSLLQEPRS